MSPLDDDEPYTFGIGDWFDLEECTRTVRAALDAYAARSDETQLAEVLEILTPTSTLLAVVPSIATRSWGTSNNAVNADS